MIWGESLLCGYQLPKHRWFIRSCWLYLPSSVSSQTIMCFKSQALKHTDANEHKHSRTANPLVHIRYTIFSSCFSSAFPNGWLNQLCGAWFKSSGMLGYCQRLVRQQGGNKVSGGEQLTSSSTFIKVCFYQDDSQTNTADRVLRHFCLVKRIHRTSGCYPAHTHTHTTVPVNLWEHTHCSTVNILRNTKRQTKSPPHSRHPTQPCFLPTS